jgi:hypothetical protein
MGFTFDDTDREGVGTSIAEMHRLTAKDMHNAECVFPFIGGEEVNNSPSLTNHRYVINFGSRSEEDSRRRCDAVTSLLIPAKRGRG